MDRQISFFDTEPDLFDAWAAEMREVIRRGSGYENGCLRIYAAYQLLDTDRFISFLGDEFGVGGHSVPGGFADYNGSGLVISHWRTDERKKWSWKKVAEAYAQLIESGSWPDAKVKAMYAEARKAGKGAPAPRMYYWGGDK